MLYSDSCRLPGLLHVYYMFACLNPEISAWSNGGADNNKFANRLSEVGSMVEDIT